MLWLSMFGVSSETWQIFIVEKTLLEYTEVDTIWFFLLFLLARKKLVKTKSNQKDM